MTRPTIGRPAGAAEYSNPSAAATVSAKHTPRPANHTAGQRSIGRGRHGAVTNSEIANAAKIAPPAAGADNAAVGAHSRAASHPADATTAHATPTPARIGAVGSETSACRETSLTTPA